MSLATLYTKKFHKETHGYYATWLPNITVAPGTVGILNGDFFTPQGSLQDIGIAFDPVRDVQLDTDPSPLDLKSTKDVKITFKMAGDISTGLPSIPQAKAGIGLEFTSTAGFVMMAAQTFEHQIKNLFALEAAIKDARERGLWKKNYAVVTAALQAPYADIVIAESNTAKLELEAAADAQLGVVKLGNANAKFTMTSESGKTLNLLGSQNVTLALRLAGLKTPLFKQPHLTPLRAQALVASNLEVPTSELHLDLLESPQQAPWSRLV